MILARVTSKGQVTIPKEIRDKLQLEAGDQIAFQTDSKGSIIIAKVEITIKGGADI